MNDVPRVISPQDRLEGRIAACVRCLPDQVDARGRLPTVAVGDVCSPQGLRGEHVLREAGCCSQDEGCDQGPDEGWKAPFHDAEELLSAPRSDLLEADKALQRKRTNGQP